MQFVETGFMRSAENIRTGLFCFLFLAMTRALIIPSHNKKDIYIRLFVFIFRPQCN